jgi:hypothetical protein
MALVWKNKTTAKTTAIDRSLRLRLYSGLRQSGSRFAAVVRRGAKEGALPRNKCNGSQLFCCAVPDGGEGEAGYDEAGAEAQP